MGASRVLGESECRALLADCQTGRVAVVAPDGPHIIPVNYALVDESIVFRTAPFTLLATLAPQHTVAFEVERTDDVTRSGWSVLARGQAVVIHDHREIEHIRRVWEPVPWADGRRHLHLRVSYRDLTGRMIGDPLPTVSTASTVRAQQWSPDFTDRGASWAPFHLR